MLGDLIRLQLKERLAAVNVANLLNLLCLQVIVAVYHDALQREQVGVDYHRHKQAASEHKAHPLEQPAGTTATLHRLWPGRQYAVP